MAAVQKSPQVLAKCIRANGLAMSYPQMTTEESEEPRRGRDDRARFRNLEVIQIRFACPLEMDRTDIEPVFKAMTPFPLASRASMFVRMKISGAMPGSTSVIEIVIRPVVHGNRRSRWSHR
jgi:hypothetical protein